MLFANLMWFYSITTSNPRFRLKYDRRERVVDAHNLCTCPRSFSTLLKITLFFMRWQETDELQVLQVRIGYALFVQGCTCMAYIARTPILLSFFFSLSSICIYQHSAALHILVALFRVALPLNCWRLFHFPVIRVGLFTVGTVASLTTCVFVLDKITL